VATRTIFQGSKFGRVRGLRPLRPTVYSRFTKFFFGAAIEVRRSTGPHTFVEAANVMLTHYQGPLKLKDWALAIR